MPQSHERSRGVVNKGTTAFNRRLGTGIKVEHKKETLSQLDLAHFEASTPERVIAGELGVLFSLNSAVSVKELIEMAKARDIFLRFHSADFGEEAQYAVATTLFDIKSEFDKRIENAKIDPDGLPVLDGVKWDPQDPLAGKSEAISPFNNTKIWAKYHVVPRQRVKPQAKGDKISLPKRSVSDIKLCETHQIRGPIYTYTPYKTKNIGFVCGKESTPVPSLLDIYKKAAGDIALRPKIVPQILKSSKFNSKCNSECNCPNNLTVNCTIKLLEKIKYKDLPRAVDRNRRIVQDIPQDFFEKNLKELTSAVVYLGPGFVTHLNSKGNVDIKLTSLADAPAQLTAITPHPTGIYWKSPGTGVYRFDQGRIEPVTDSVGYRFRASLSTENAYKSWVWQEGDQFKGFAIIISPGAINKCRKKIPNPIYWYEAQWKSIKYLKGALEEYISNTTIEDTIRQIVIDQIISKLSELIPEVGLVLAGIELIKKDLAIGTAIHATHSEDIEVAARVIAMVLVEYIASEVISRTISAGKKAFDYGKESMTGSKKNRSNDLIENTATETGSKKNRSSDLIENTATDQNSKRTYDRSLTGEDVKEHRSTIASQQASRSNNVTRKGSPTPEIGNEIPALEKEEVGFSGHHPDVPKKPWVRRYRKEIESQYGKVFVNDSEVYAYKIYIQDKRTKKLVPGERNTKDELHMPNKDEKGNQLKAVDQIMVTNNDKLIPIEVKNQNMINISKQENSALKKFETIVRYSPEEIRNRISHFEIFVNWKGSKLPYDYKVESNGRLWFLVDGSKSPSVWEPVEIGGKPVFVFSGDLGKLGQQSE